MPSTCPPSIRLIETLAPRYQIMPKAPLTTLVQQLKAMVAGPRLKAETDRQLLDRFAQTRDEVAFAALVERHGPLVLGVCRRVLRHDQDAEDVFQATFLVLARKAGKVLWQESVRSWLYQVAHRLALEARTRNYRRQAREKAFAAEPKPVEELSWQEVRAVLEEELARLPAKFRAPLLLCCLDGKTRDEAAEQLGWTVGTVKGRLERGRKLLKSRLTRRGLTLSAALFTTLLGQAASAAPVPALLTVATVKSGVMLATGQALTGIVSAEVLTLTGMAMRSLAMAKLKVVTAVLLTVSVLTGGAGLVSRQMLVSGANKATPAQLAEEMAAASPAPAPPATAPAEPPPPRPEKERQASERPDVLGLLQRLDVERGTINIARLEDGAPRDQTFALAPNVEVRIDGNKPGRLQELPQDVRVGLFLMPDRKTVIRLQAEGPTQRRQINAVDAREGYLVVSEEPRRLKVADDAVVTVSGRRTKLADLPPGPAMIKFSVDRRTVIAIQAGSNKERDEGVRREK